LYLYQSDHSKRLPLYNKGQERPIGYKEGKKDYVSFNKDYNSQERPKGLKERKGIIKATKVKKGLKSPKNQKSLIFK
jgi:hypothetical protein